MALPLSPDAIQFLTEKLAFANTPSVLVRRLRQNITVQRMAEAHTADELLEMLAQQLQAENWGMNELATSYALLVALLDHFPTQVHRARELPGFDRLSWGDRIISLSSVKQTPTIVTTVSQHMLPPGPEASTSSTTKVIRLHHPDGGEQ